MRLAVMFICMEAVFFGGGLALVFVGIKRGFVTEQLWRNGERLTGAESKGAGVIVIFIGLFGIAVGVLLLHAWANGRIVM
jgi:hypothetical protein